MHPRFRSVPNNIIKVYLLWSSVLAWILLHPRYKCAFQVVLLVFNKSLRNDAANLCTFRTQQPGGLRDQEYALISRIPVEQVAMACIHLRGSCCLSFK